MCGSERYKSEDEEVPSKHKGLGLLDNADCHVLALKHVESEDTLSSNDSSGFFLLICTLSSLQDT